MLSFELSYGVSVLLSRRLGTNPLDLHGNALRLDDGDAIPIEQRDPKEVTHGFGTQTAPSGIHVYNPAFDVTPARLIRGIITEKGLIHPVNRETISSVIGVPLSA